MQTQESGLQIPCSPCNTLPPPNPHHGHLLRLPYKISKEVEFILFVIHIPQEYKLHEADLFLPCVQRLILQFLQQCPAHSKCKGWTNEWMNESSELAGGLGSGSWFLALVPSDLCHLWHTQLITPVPGSVQVPRSKGPEFESLCHHWVTAN